MMTLALRRELRADVYERHVEKLRLVDSHHFRLGGHEEHRGRIVYRRGRYGVVVVADYVLLGIARVYGGLVNLYALLGKPRPLQAAYEFFGFS